jgi:hypothetical protein
MAPSFSSTRSYLALQKSTVHPLLALSVPSLFLLSLDALVRAAVPTLSFPPLWSLLLVLVGVEEVALANLLFVERAGRGARLRELLSILVLTWLALAVIRSIRTGSVSVIHPDFIYPLVLVSLQWVLVWSIHVRLREREILLSAIAGKKGVVLLHELRDASMQAAVAARGLSAVKLLASLFQVVIFALLLFCAAQRIRVGAAGLILCAANAVVGLLAAGILSMFGEHQLLLGEGLVAPVRLERSRFLAMLTVLLVCLPAALLASRGDAPFPLSGLISLLDRLLRLLPSIPLSRFADAAGRMVLEQQRYQALMRTLPPVSFNPMFLLLLLFLRRLVPVFILMVVYFFLVSPLLSEDFLQSLRSRSLLSFLLDKLRNLVRFFRRLARVMRGVMRGSRRRRRSVEDIVGGNRGTAFESRFPLRAPSLRKRLQVGRVLKAFQGLLLWSAGRGVSYNRSETPREYSLRLLSVVPMMGAEMDVVIEVLEESLFSTHLVGAEPIKAYMGAIDKVRRSPAPQTAATLSRRRGPASDGERQPGTFPPG